MSPALCVFFQLDCEPAVHQPACTPSYLCICDFVLDFTVSQIQRGNIQPTCYLNKENNIFTKQEISQKALSLKDL